ncbi:CheR family methyltransferase [Roseobacter sp. S98]|uniref:CheR family methyltransferase n=1 Tax=Roseobacter algicola (ex Choi et al. 2025) (nom. illeg.) TaxID=3092138 RepID=UPI0035C6FA88
MNQHTNMQLSPTDFDIIAQIAYRESGLQLVKEKSSMIQSRLRHRVNALGLPGFETYTKHVASESGKSELRHMISALTTNVSHFFREQHHFDILKDRVIPQLKSKIENGEKIRIWSAGCSNGQEGYSIAMCLMENIANLKSFDVKILGTDIDPKVVEFASQGLYPQRLLEGVPKEFLHKYFQSSATKTDDTFSVIPELTKIVAFKELNLLAKWPMKMKFDVIFCRNVVIYFDLETQNSLWPRFHSSLKEDGIMFLGHSERINNHEKLGFYTDGPTTYRPGH